MLIAGLQVLPLLNSATFSPIIIFYFKTYLFVVGGNLFVDHSSQMGNILNLTGVTCLTPNILNLTASSLIQVVWITLHLSQFIH